MRRLLLEAGARVLEPVESATNLSCTHFLFSSRFYLDLLEQHVRAVSLYEFGPAQTAVRENCADVVRHVARCGRRFEPENSFWQNLLDLLPRVQIDLDKMPHPTRFVEMTGIDRGRVGRFIRWIRPRQPLAA
jgi:hypothetical protein